MIIEGKQLELEDPFDTASWGFIPTSTKNMRFINLSSTIEHIGIDILWTSISDFELQVKVIKPVLWGNINWEPASLMPLWRTAAVK